MIHTIIVTSKGQYKELDTTAIQVYTIEGQMMILPNHMPIIAMLTKSPCIFWIHDEKKTFIFSNGVMQFENNQMIIVCEAMKSNEEIDIVIDKKVMNNQKSI